LDHAHPAKPEPDVELPLPLTLRDAPSLNELIAAAVVFSD